VGVKVADQRLLQVVEARALDARPYHAAVVVQLALALLEQAQRHPNERGTARLAMPAPVPVEVADPDEGAVRPAVPAAETTSGRTFSCGRFGLGVGSHCSSSLLTRLA